MPTFIKGTIDWLIEQRLLRVQYFRNYGLCESSLEKLKSLAVRQRQSLVNKSHLRNPIRM